MNINDLCSDVYNNLKDNQNDLWKLYSVETGYKIEHISLLWSDLEKFFIHFPALYDQKVKAWNENIGYYNQWEEGSSYLRVPWGRVLICTPSNSVIPLLPIFITSFCCVGNDVILAPSRKTLKTAKWIFEILKNIKGFEDCNINFWGNGGESAIEKYVINHDLDLLFFQGSSKNRNDIYKVCIENGVDVIFEGEGDIITIIDYQNYDPSFQILLNKLQSIKSFCNGNLCTTPSLILVQNSTYQMYREMLVEVSSNVHNLYEFDPNYSNNRSGFDIFVYNDLSELKQLRRSYKFGLQVAIFSEKPEKIEEFVLKNIHVGRITVNKNPTYQNSLIPWGGYKNSGHSRVYDFLDKSVKTVIVEKQQTKE